VQSRASRVDDGRRVVSLFTGAGGLDLGLEAAGFRTVYCVESDESCREVLRRNRPSWSLADVRDVNAMDIDAESAGILQRHGPIDLVAGGPPCQPFSKSGRWVNGVTRGLADPRAQTLDSFFKFVEGIQPRAFLLENVVGLAHQGERGGLGHVRELVSGINERTGADYRPHAFVLNAADHGVPQIRKRLFVMAERTGRQLAPPAATHSPDATGSNTRYLTAWDAIGDLDVDGWSESLRPTGKWAGVLPSIPEGSNYLWHTERGGGVPLFGWRTRYWSFLLKLAKDKPSWTIQAETGPATGPFHWRSRLLSIQELARLQTFPDGFEFSAGRRQAVRQIGNAVPPLLGEVVGRAILEQLFHAAHRDNTVLGLDSRGDPPDPEGTRELPPEYATLVGPHKPHPGVGLGPRRLLQRAEATEQGLGSGQDAD